MEHISYSQWNTYTNCPRSWYLQYKTDAPQKQTWYLPVGTTVHRTVEAHLKGESYDLEQIFYGLIKEQRKIEPNVDEWLAGGSTSDPVTRGKALQLAKDCHERALEWLSDLDVHHVEFDATGSLPGLSVPVKAFIDILGEHKKHGMVILDWKTGASKPKSNFQLETYAALLKSNFTYQGYGTGVWAMLAPKASEARKIDLSNVSPLLVGDEYEKVYKLMQRKRYKADVKFGCKFCFHQENCLDKAGPNQRTKYYDRSAEDGIPF
jgi:RecB family exonuclease